MFGIPKLFTDADAEAFEIRYRKCCVQKWFIGF